MIGQVLGGFGILGGGVAQVAAQHPTDPASWYQYYRNAGYSHEVAVKSSGRQGTAVLSDGEGLRDDDLILLMEK